MSSQVFEDKQCNFLPLFLYLVVSFKCSRYPFNCSMFVITSEGSMCKDSTSCRILSPVIQRCAAIFRTLDYQFY